MKTTYIDEIYVGDYAVDVCEYAKLPWKCGRCCRGLLSLSKMHLSVLS